MLNATCTQTTMDLHDTRFYKAVICLHLRRGMALDFPVSLFFGCASGAKETAMIFLVSQILYPVRVILVS